MFAPASEEMVEMGFFDDIGDFLEDAADVVVDVAGDVVGGVADAVSSIPVVGDVVEAAAPFAGMLGTLVGGPIGGAVGNAVGGAFGDGGGPFDFFDGAVGAIGDALPGPLGDLAGELMDGGSLIDTATSIFGGGLPGIDDVAGMAGGLLDGLPDSGGLADLGGIADAAGGLLDGGVPDLGGIIGAASSVFGGLGIGDLASAAQGVIGEVAPDLSDAGGWLGSLGDSIAGGGDMITNCWNIPDYGDIGGPIGAAGGNWLEQIAEQAGDVAQQLAGAGGGIFGQIQDNFEQFDTGSWPYNQLDDVADVVIPVPLPDNGTIQDFADTGLDDLVFNLPGVDRDGAARDALQQLAETGGLGEALATLSPDDLTSLVTRLVTPVSPAVDAINDDLMQVQGGGIGDETFAADGSGGDVINAPLGIDLDDLDDLDDLGDGSAATSVDGEGSAVEPGVDGDAAAAAGVDTGLPGDDFSIDGGGDTGFQAPAEPEFTAPEPEPVESDFNQAIAQADAVDQSFDDMFEDLE